MWILKLCSPELEIYNTKWRILAVGSGFYTCWSWIQGPSCIFFQWHTHCLIEIFQLWHAFNCGASSDLMHKFWEQIECKLVIIIYIILQKMFQNLLWLDVLEESMMSCILIILCCITLKNRWASLSWEFLQKFNFCSDPLTYDPIGQLKNNRW